MAGLGGGGTGGSAGAIRAGRAYVEAFLDDNKLNRGLKLMEARLKKAGAALTRVGGQLALGGGLAIAPAARQFVQFDDAMRMVKATSQATEAEFQSLTAHARELGRTTSFTADHVANLMVELARAGFKPAEVEEMTLAVLDLARATGTDATESAGFMAATLRQFSLGAGDATRVADALTQTANATFNSVTDLGYALKYSGTVAGDLGMSLEDTLALLGGLGQVNIRGEMGGTTLRRLLTLTASEATEFQKVFGVAAKDAAGNARPLLDVMDEVYALLQKMGTAEANEKLAEFFGILGITGASVVGRTGQSIREIRDDIAGAGGVARRTAKEMDAGLGGSFRRLRGSVVDSAIAVGGALAPALEFVSVVFKGVANDVSEWVANNREAAAAIGAAVVSLTALGGVLFTAGIAFKALGLAVGVVSAALGVAAAAITFLLTPMGMVAVILGELALLLNDGSGWTEFAETAKEAWGGIVAALQKGDIELAFQIIAAAFRLEWAKVANWWTELWESAVNEVHLAMTKLHDFFAKPDPTVTTGLAGAGLVFGGKLGDFKTWEELEAHMAGVRAEAEKAAKEFVPFEDIARGEIAAAKAKRIAAFEEELKKRRDELKALTDKAKAGLPEAPMPRELFTAPMPRAVGARAGGVAAGIADSVKGAFAVPNGRLMFGMGTGFERRHLNAAEKTAKATAATAKAAENFILAMSFK